MTRIWVIGHTHHRRTTGFLSAATRAGLQVGGCIPYTKLLEQGMDALDAIEPGDRIKLESPGEEPKVGRLLLSRAGLVDPPELEHGEMRDLTRTHLGFVDLLSEISAALEPRGAVLLNPAAEIAACFDKVETHAILTRAGLPTPPRLEPELEDLDALVAEMDRAGRHQVFIKPRYGASAVGVVAYRRDRRGRQVAYTSMEVVRSGGRARIFNHTEIQRYDREQDIRTVIETTLREGAVVEAWLPKASHEGLALDLRVVVIAGRARHAVVRTSRSPITNLHLGNRRGDVLAVRERMGAQRWQATLEVAEAARRAVGESFCVGLDILLSSRGWEPCILEVNAFGDFLPGALHEGETVYGAQARTLAEVTFDEA